MKDGVMLQFIPLLQHYFTKRKIHFFEDVGYYHVPFTNCPVDKEVRKARNCNCDPNKDFTWRAILVLPNITLNNFKDKRVGKSTLLNQDRNEDREKTPLYLFHI